MEDEHSDIDDSESDTMTACSEDSTPQNSSQDSASLRKDEESTILDYARRHGLCQDYRSRNPLDSITLPSPIPEKALDFDYFGGLADLELPSSVIQDERWTLDQGGAQYLQSILPTLEDHSNFEYPAQRHKFRRLKLECPLLKTDDQLDMKKLFARRQKPLALDTIQLDRIPDAKGEEGLQWPTCDPSLLTRKDQEARSETLQASFADMSYLRDTLEVSCDECEVEAAIQLELQRHKNTLPYMSPPLSPISPISSPGEVDSTAYEIDFTSTPTDPSTEELRMIDHSIMEKDGIDEESFTPFALHSAEQSDDQKMSSSPARPESKKRPRPNDLKMEGPLTPQDDQSSPSKKSKTVNFMGDLAQTIPSSDRFMPCPDAPSSQQEYDQFFDEMIDLAEPAIRETKHEKLIEADSTARIQVPDMKDDETVPPWMHFSRVGHARKRKFDSELAAQQEMLAVSKQDHLADERPWHTSGDKDLVWVPFAASVCQAVTEESFDESALAIYLKGLTFDEPIDSVNLVWKREGLRILDQDEDEDEDEEHQCMMINADQGDMSALVRRRQKDFENPNWQTEAGSQVATPAIQLSYADTDNTMRGRNMKETGPSSLDHFSPFGSLSQFMQIQTGKNPPKPRLLQSITIPQPATDMDVAAEAEKTPKHIQTKDPEISLPLPPIQDSSRSCQYLISSTLFPQRDFVRGIERLLPTAQLIERDFKGRLGLAGSNRLGIEEADILLSPSTGLVLAPLQKIKQKALPGQPALLGVRDRLTRLSPRYEHVIVLVSEGAVPSHSAGPPTVRSLDQNDCDALTSLMAFAASLEANVKVNYVPGGETELASWAASCMTRYGNESQVKLVQDETLWEVFLRNAGMNAFAAQAVLGMLKKPDDPQMALEQCFGLAAFVKMSAEKRVNTFSALLGGGHVLRRVSRVLDSRWISASNS